MRDPDSIPCSTPPRVSTAAPARARNIACRCRRSPSKSLKPTKSSGKHAHHGNENGRNDQEHRLLAGFIAPALARVRRRWRRLATTPARPARPLSTEMVLDLGDGITMKLVQIPAGKFLMGSPADEQGRNADEGVAPADAKGGKTQVEVTISKPFYIGVYEVTVDQYKQFSPKNDKRGNIMTWGPGSPEYHQRGGIPFFNWSFEKKAVKSEQDGSHPAVSDFAGGCAEILRMAVREDR